MDPTRRLEINRIAQKVRSALELTQVPFPVDTAVQRLGGSVELADLKEGEALVRKRDASFVIQVKNQAEVRRRFSVAHELGHLFLHMGFILDPTRWERIDEYLDSPKFRYGFSEEEYEAHEFAAALLMPEEEFRNVVRKFTSEGTVELSPIADHFQVSMHAARVRGQWLGIFEWGQ